MGKKALRIRHIIGREMRKKRRRNPHICFSLTHTRPVRSAGRAILPWQTARQKRNGGVRVVGAKQQVFATYVVYAWSERACELDQSQERAVIGW